MKNSPNLFMKWPLLTAVVLCAGTYQAKAQERPTPQGMKAPTNTKAVLGRNSRELLKRYGKPTAICVFPGLLANKSELPAGVPQLSSTPQWAQSASLSSSPAVPATGMMWFYKRNGHVVSYRMDRLGFVDAACIATSEKPNAEKAPDFEVSPLPAVVIGEASKNVLERYGFPDEIRSTEPKFTEFVYLDKTPPSSYENAYATVFTLRDNQVVRVYSYGYIPSPSQRVPSDRLPSDPSKNGRYFLLKPIVIPHR